MKKLLLAFACLLVCFGTVLAGERPLPAAQLLPPVGSLYSMSNLPTVATINPVNGKLVRTVTAQLAPDTYVFGLAFNPQDRLLYTLSEDPQFVSLGWQLLNTINPHTGETNGVGLVARDSNTGPTRSLAFDHHGNLLGMRQKNLQSTPTTEFMQFDLSSGQLTTLSTFNGSQGSLSGFVIDIDGTIVSILYPPGAHATAVYVKIDPATGAIVRRLGPASASSLTVTPWGTFYGFSGMNLVTVNIKTGFTHVVAANVDPLTVYGSYLAFGW